MKGMKRNGLAERYLTTNRQMVCDDCAVKVRTGILHSTPTEPRRSVCRVCYEAYNRSIEPASVDAMFDDVKPGDTLTVWHSRRAVIGSMLAKIVGRVRVSRVYREHFAADDGRRYSKIDGIEVGGGHAVFYARRPDMLAERRAERWEG